MKERPIIMSAGSIRAILDGRKSQTRRTIKPQPWHEGSVWKWTRKGRVDDIEQFMRMDRVMWDDRYTPMGLSQFCPYGQVGDILWCRETWVALYHKWWAGAKPVIKYKADDVDADIWEAKWKSPIYMPKKYARIWLEVVSVRAERLQEITLEDVIAEDVDLSWIEPWMLAGTTRERLARGKFHMVWDSLNAKRGHAWSMNDWVWVVSFRAVNKP